MRVSHTSMVCPFCVGSRMDRAGRTELHLDDNMDTGKGWFRRCVLCFCGDRIVSSCCVDGIHVRRGGRGSAVAGGRRRGTWCLLSNPCSLSLCKDHGSIHLYHALPRSLDHDQACIPILRQVYSSRGADRRVAPEEERGRIEEDTGGHERETRTASCER